MTARGPVRILGLLLTLGLAASASPAASQIDPLFEGEAVVLPGIDVAAFSGPPWWTVSDADSTVYILASPGAPVASWDTALLEQRLKGAKRLILQPDMKAGLFYAMPRLKEVAAVILTARSTRLESALRPTANMLPAHGTALETFRNERQKAGMPETRYGGLPLSLAAFALAGDVYERLPYPDAPGEAVEQTATRIAQNLKLRVEPAFSYGEKEASASTALTSGESEWIGFLNSIARVNESCIDATLKDLAQAPARVRAIDPGQTRAMTQAWAHGDVTPLIATYRDGSRRTGGITVQLDTERGSAPLTVATPTCLRQIPVFREISERWLTDETLAVIQALKTPGKTVVIYRAADLIFVGGVLDQLMKRGLTIKARSPRMNRAAVSA